MPTIQALFEKPAELKFVLYYSISLTGNIFSYPLQEPS